MPETILKVEDLTVGYQTRVIQKDLNFSVQKGKIFIVMGGSGCGKSTLLSSLIGLNPPIKGNIFFGDVNYWGITLEERDILNRTFWCIISKWCLMELNDFRRKCCITSCLFYRSNYR